MSSERLLEVARQEIVNLYGAQARQFSLYCKASIERNDNVFLSCLPSVMAPAHAPRFLHQCDAPIAFLRLGGGGGGGRGAA